MPAILMFRIMSTSIDSNINERSAAVIDLSAVRANTAAFRALQSQRRDKPMLMLCAVKADAYGHGAVEVSKSIADITDYFGVACVEEGVELRNAGITNPILVFGAELYEGFENAVTNDLTLAVFDVERAKELNDCAAGLHIRAKIHIAVDTGMSRIGLKPDESGISIIRQIMLLPNIEITGIFTHFATADEMDKTQVREAYSKFSGFKKLCTANGIDAGIWHCANTAASIDNIGLDDEMDMARCGIGIYGLYPSDEVHKEYISLKPALKWFSYLSYIKEVKAGTKVSYGYNYTAEHDMLIGTIACGYADGYRRALSRNGAEVIIRGKRCPVIGTICMDQMMTDLTNVPEARLGDRVVLIGTAEDSFAGAEPAAVQHEEATIQKEPQAERYAAAAARSQSEDLSPQSADTYAAPVTADELAERCDTISYELICGIGGRTKRIYHT